LQSQKQCGLSDSRTARFLPGPGWPPCASSIHPTMRASEPHAVTAVQTLGNFARTRYVREAEP